MWAKIKQELYERLVHWENIVWGSIIYGCIDISSIAYSRPNFVLINGVIDGCFVVMAVCIYKIGYNPIKEIIREEEMVIKRKLGVEADNVAITPQQ